MYPLILGCAGEKPYVCEYCDARFSHQTHLVVHTRRHTGDRPYKCSLCEASYARKNLLVIHIRKHTGELHSAMLQDKFACSYSYAQNIGVSVNQMSVFAISYFELDYVRTY